MKKFLKWLAIIFIGIPFCIAVLFIILGENNNTQSSKLKSDQNDNGRTLNPEKIDDNYKKKIPNNVYLEMTQKGYPKAYKQWGQKGFDKINALAPKAAELVAKSKSCDEIIDVSLSDAKSTPNKKIVFFVDCKNKERFYVSDADIELGYNAVSISEEFEKINKSSYYEACLKGIKNQANFPSTVDTSIFNRSIRPSVTGGIQVYMEFSAKNGFGLEEKFVAECNWAEKGRKSEIKIFKK